MKYTLYIDESGDFQSPKVQWVISGVLFADTYENCEKFLNSNMLNVPSQLGLNSIKQFHLTEFRRNYGHKEAVNMAKIVLNKLDNLPFDYHCLAAINFTKSSLSSREKTYRLMLADLLALCETVVPEDDIIENLDLVVASRTIDGVLATSISNINEEIIKSLPVALEVDLATKGMVELIGKHIKVRMDYANNSWGLVCADFLANLNYNNQNEPEKKYLATLAEEGKYSLFESFGGYDVRRANIAERDKDFVLSLYRWIVIYGKGAQDGQAKEAIDRLLYKVFNKRGTSGQSATFEAIIERLWRNHNNINQYNSLSLMLKLFDEEFKKYLDKNNLQKYKNLLFRLRNMILLVENHLGNVDKANLVAIEQNHVIIDLASNPENFQMILDFKIHEIELSINSLELEKALSQASKYYSMVQNYKEIWKLLIEEEEVASFEESRASIKAEMALMRCETLSNIVYDENSVLQKLHNFKTVKELLSHNMDLSRLNNYQVMFFLKQKEPKKAVDFCLSLYENISSAELNYFDLLWFLHAVNDSLLKNEKIKIQTLKKSIDFQISKLDPNKKGHPMDLIWREVALYQYLSGDKSNALKSIKKSKNAFDLGNSPISKWLIVLIEIHNDFINDKIKNIEDYFDDVLYIDLVKNLDSNVSILERVRLASPY